MGWRGIRFTATGLPSIGTISSALAGSLKMGRVKPSQLVRSLQRGRGVATLGRAIGELGRISKTLHVLNVIADPGSGATDCFN
jgi:hypothetical protein